MQFLLTNEIGDYTEHQSFHAFWREKQCSGLVWLGFFKKIFKKEEKRKKIHLLVQLIYTSYDPPTASPKSTSWKAACPHIHHRSLIFVLRYGIGSRGQIWQCALWTEALCLSMGQHWAICVPMLYSHLTPPCPHGPLFSFLEAYMAAQPAIHVHRAELAYTGITNTHRRVWATDSRPRNAFIPQTP